MLATERQTPPGHVYIFQLEYYNQCEKIEKGKINLSVQVTHGYCFGYFSQVLFFFTPQCHVHFCCQPAPSLSFEPVTCFSPVWGMPTPTFSLSFVWIETSGSLAYLILELEPGESPISSYWALSVLPRSLSLGFSTAVSESGFMPWQGVWKHPDFPAILTC